jgi:uncharacterized protein (TIGR00255 family)
MYKSMTGYGKAICELASKTITIEVKSLNSKSLDLNIRIPSVFKDKELHIRNLVAQYLDRGKVDLSIYAENKPGSNQSRLNLPAIENYYHQFKEIHFFQSLSDEAILTNIMRLPDSIDTGRDELAEEEWPLLEIEIIRAIKQVDEFRRHEGVQLRNDVLNRLEKIFEHIPKVEEFEPDRIQRIKTRMQEQLNDILTNNSIDSNRFEQELIYYLEKLDITEEKVRLKAHCEFFRDVSSQPEPSGKKLGFIVQEMGREINTLGSKANHQQIQRIVVEMKDELEKIKEQLLNIL